MKITRQHQKQLETAYKRANSANMMTKSHAERHIAGVVAVANLAAQWEREECAKVVDELHYSDDSGNRVYIGDVAVAIRRREREACAKVAENLYRATVIDGDTIEYDDDVAAAIRQRESEDK